MSLIETIARIQESLLFARMHLARVDKLIEASRAPEPEEPFDLEPVTLRDTEFELVEEQAPSRPADGSVCACCAQRVEG